MKMGECVEAGKKEDLLSDASPFYVKSQRGSAKSEHHPWPNLNKGRPDTTRLCFGCL